MGPLNEEAMRQRPHCGSRVYAWEGIGAAPFRSAVGWAHRPRQSRLLPLVLLQAAAASPVRVGFACCCFSLSFFFKIDKSALYYLAVRTNQCTRRQRRCRHTLRDSRVLTDQSRHPCSPFRSRPPDRCRRPHRSRSR